MDLTVFDIYVVSADAFHANLRRECAKCGHFDQFQGFVAGFLFNYEFKCVLSDTPRKCTSCGEPSISLTVFESKDEVHEAIRRSTSLIESAQRNKTLAMLPLAGLLKVDEATFDCDLEPTALPYTLNS